MGNADFVGDLRPSPGAVARRGHRLARGEGSTSCDDLGWLGPENVAWLVRRAGRRWPDRAAITDGEREVTYAELVDRVAAYAGDLTRAGVEAGDRVVILGRRTPESAAAFFGVLAIRAIAVVAAEKARRPQVEHLIADSGATAMLTARPERQAAELDVHRLGPNEHRPRPTQDRPAGNALAQLIHTSGSSGQPKGVMVSHQNLWAGTIAVSSYLGIRADDRIASVLPFGFDYGLNQLLLAVAEGAVLVIERSPVPARIDRTVRDSGVTVLAGVPMLWHQLLGSQRFPSEPAPALRICTNSGGHLPAPTVSALRQAQPQAEVFLMYGLTEAFRSTYLAPSMVDAKPASVGRAIPRADVQVVRRDASACAPGEIGEIVHRGPTVALGYWNDPDATRRVFRHPCDGPVPPGQPVVHSGDFGWVDDDGDLYVIGRRDRMVKRFGQRVSPDEVTAALHASGLVVDACTTIGPAGPEPRQVTAHVVLRGGATASELDRYLRGEWPRHLWPSQIVSHRELPTTPNGKPDLRALGERLS